MDVKISGWWIFPIANINLKNTFGTERPGAAKGSSGAVFRRNRNGGGSVLRIARHISRVPVETRPPAPPLAIPRPLSGACKSNMSSLCRSERTHSHTITSTARYSWTQTIELLRSASHYARLETHRVRNREKSFRRKITRRKLNAFIDSSCCFV